MFEYKVIKPCFYQGSFRDEEKHSRVFEPKKLAKVPTSLEFVGEVESAPDEVIPDPLAPPVVTPPNPGADFAALFASPEAQALAAEFDEAHEAPQAWHEVPGTSAEQKLTKGDVEAAIVAAEAAAG